MTTLARDAVGGSAPRGAAQPGVSRLARRLLHDRRVRFLVVGGVNTAFGYGCFLLYQHVIGRYHGYMLSLALSHVTSVVFAFVTHRRLVFRVSGSVLRDLWRFESVYLTSLSVNAALLPLAVELGHVPVAIAQGGITVLGVVMSWLGHSRFSFRRPLEVAQ